MAWIEQRRRADGGLTAPEFAIDPAQFHDAFGADLPSEQTAVMAATQRPVADLCLFRALRSARLEVSAKLGSRGD